jgi:hypothetical protein
MASDTGSAQTSSSHSVLSLLASLLERLARVSCKDAAHSELLARQIQEWDNLLTRPASSSSPPIADVLPVSIAESDHEQPTTCLDLDECLEKVFTFVQLEPGRSSSSIVHLDCGPRPKVSEYGCVCTNFKRCIEALSFRRRDEQRAVVIDRFPGFIDVEARYGRPVELLPYPSWRQFKVAVWFYFDGHHINGTAWLKHHVQWVTSLSEVGRVWCETTRTGGLYKHVQLVVTMWMFDMIDQVWEEEDHI